MNVLIVGYGSIGRRHVLNLSKLAHIDKIVVYTKIKADNYKYCEKDIVFVNSSKLTLNDVCKIYPFDFAIISNETFKHIDTAIILAGKGLDILIEKPLSHNMEKINVLNEIIQNKKIKILIGYNLRFLPAMQYIKSLITKETIGALYFAKIEVGQYLPSWRTNINYIDSYSSHAKYGGGVALDLSHEVDYMRYLFGEPRLWKTMRSKVSDLEINAEDIFEGIYQYPKGFVCNVHMDYLQRTSKRKIRIVGNKGTIVCDLINKWIETNSQENKIRLTDDKIFKIEDTYIEELRYFIKMKIFNEESNISINDGIKAMKLLDDGHDWKE